MPKKSDGRTDSNLEAGIAKANAIIQELALQDGVDTSQYGFMVRKAGAKSLALHRGLHPSEEAPSPLNGSRDPRLPRAQTGLSVFGALKTDLVQDIHVRHAELVHLHRWWQDLDRRTPTADDFRWDPVILEMLRLHDVDLDTVVAKGPGEFVSPLASRDHPSVEHVVEDVHADQIAYLGCIDGDTVRALQVRYAKGISYSWKRTQPDHVELLVKDRVLPDTVLHGLRGATFMTVVEHASLAPVIIRGYAQIGSTISFKSATRLVRPRLGTDDTVQRHARTTRDPGGTIAVS